MKIDLTELEITVVSLALREWRTVIPKNIADDEARLKQWRTEKEVWEPDRYSAEAKIRDALADMGHSELAKDEARIAKMKESHET